MYTKLNKFKKRKQMNNRTKRTKSNDLTLFIGGLPGNIKHLDVFDYFRNNFKGTFKVYLKFKKNGLSAGYGTVKVSSKEAYDQIIDMTHFIKKRQIECRPYYSSSSFAKYQKDFYNSRVYVTKIPSNVDNQRLKQIFEMAGKVTKAYIIHNNKPAHLYNFGYVVFKNPSDAIKAVKIQKFPFEDKILLCKKFDQKKKQKPSQKSNTESEEGNSESSGFEDVPYNKRRGQRRTYVEDCNNEKQFCPSAAFPNEHRFFSQDYQLSNGIPHFNQGISRVHPQGQWDFDNEETYDIRITDFLVENSELDRVSSRKTVQKLRRTINQINFEAKNEYFGNKKILNIPQVKLSHLSFNGNIQLNKGKKTQVYSSGPYNYDSLSQKNGRFQNF